jgi:hypothetical protein
MEKIKNEEDVTLLIRHSPSSFEESERLLTITDWTNLEYYFHDLVIVLFMQHSFLILIICGSHVRHDSWPIIPIPMTHVSYIYQLSASDERETRFQTLDSFSVSIRYHAQ